MGGRVLFGRPIDDGVDGTCGMPILLSDGVMQRSIDDGYTAVNKELDVPQTNNFSQSIQRFNRSELSATLAFVAIKANKA